jgi:hypothetical protein
MTAIARLQSLLENQAQRLVERINHGNRCGVMIEALLAPIALYEHHVQIPALHGTLAL